GVTDSARASARNPSAQTVSEAEACLEAPVFPPPALLSPAGSLLLSRPPHADMTMVSPTAAVITMPRRIPASLLVGLGVTAGICDRRPVLNDHKRSHPHCAMRYCKFQITFAERPPHRREAPPSAA